MEDVSGFFIDDGLAVEPLAELGWSLQNVPWTAAGVDWSHFDAVVIRSTWDYQKFPEQFLKTLESIEAAGTRLFNPLAVCQWNLHKSYIRDLEQRGIPVVPTWWYDRLDETTLVASFEVACSERIIVKPVIGANADDTYLLRRDDPAGWGAALEAFADRALMLQPFLVSVVETGEYSLFWFAGEYSHAVLKNPRQGDFRVQEEHGGSVHSVEPSPALLRIGNQILATLDSPLLYARVDLVLLADDSPVLIELELIEPTLHFSTAPESAPRFAKKLNALAGSPTGRLGSRSEQ